MSDILTSLAFLCLGVALALALAGLALLTLVSALEATGTLPEGSTRTVLYRLVEPTSEGDTP